MIPKNWLFILLLTGVCLTVSVPTSQAQGLLWTLPADGEWVHYEGTYSQVELNADAEGRETPIKMTRHLYIKSVGSEKAMYRGKEETCRWIEFKLIMGTDSAAGVDAGPGGERIVKVLIPESSIIQTPYDKDKIRIEYVPVIKGFQKIGQNKAEPLPVPVLQIYPLLSSLTHYIDIKPGGEAADPEVPVGPMTATPYKCMRQLEGATSRSTNEATIWRTDEVPFGLAKWTVRVVRESKQSIESRDNFKPVSQVTVEMAAQEKGTDAKSELITE